MKKLVVLAVIVAAALGLGAKSANAALPVHTNTWVPAGTWVLVREVELTNPADLWYWYGYVDHPLYCGPNFKFVEGTSTVRDPLDHRDCWWATTAEGWVVDEECENAGEVMAGDIDPRLSFPPERVHVMDNTGQFGLFNAVCTGGLDP